MSIVSSNAHYARTGLLDAIRDGVRALGKEANTLTIDDLASVDEFHIGGRKATIELVDQLDLSPNQIVLDIGCGLGGPARFVAHRYSCRVEGVDLTSDYVETGTTLCRWLTLDRLVTLQCADALDLPFPNESFDSGYMLHVGMNVADKDALFAEAARALKPGAAFGIYDVMRSSDGALAFPVPWATAADASAEATQEQYRDALERAGFSVLSVRNRRTFALDYFAQQQAAVVAAGKAPPLGMQTLMGERRRSQVENMIANIANGLIAPVEMIARRRT